jgi:diacylglycerol kinase (ATP)
VDELHALLANRDTIDIQYLEPSGTIGERVKDALGQGYRTLIAAGGDGTLTEVVNGLAGWFDQVQLGIIPLGTANDLSKVLKIPSDLEGALAVVTAGRTKAIDLIKASFTPPRYIINAITGGVSTKIAESLDTQTKTRWGGWSYLKQGLLALKDIERFKVGIEINGERIESETTALIIANGRYAGGLHLVPDASLEDTKLDLAVVTATSLTEVTKLAYQAILQQQLQSEHVIYRRALRISLESQPEMGLISDGEEVGKTPATFEVVPRVLKVLVPEE